MKNSTQGMDKLILALIRKNWPDEKICNLLAWTIRQQTLDHIRQLRRDLDKPEIEIDSTDPDVRLAAIVPRLAELRTRLEAWTK